MLRPLDRARTVRGVDGNICALSSLCREVSRLEVVGVCSVALAESSDAGAPDSYTPGLRGVNSPAVGLSGVVDTAGGRWSTAFFEVDGAIVCAWWRRIWSRHDDDTGPGMEEHRRHCCGMQCLVFVYSTNSA